MLDALRFVQGAVARKDFVPELKHFIIKDGYVRAFNGVLALSSPIDLDLACAPVAQRMIKAIQGCSDVVALALTDTGRLRVQSGPFKVFVPCVDVDQYPDIKPTGEMVTVPGVQLYEAVQALSPFVGDDASRPWTNGILFHGMSAFATNNVCLAQHWLGVPMPRTINVPMAAITEVLRVGQPPNAMQVDDNSVTFHYPDGRWIRSSLYETSWPEVEQILAAPCDPQPIPEGFFDALEAIKPFLEQDGLVYLGEDNIRTMDTELDGTIYEVPGLQVRGVYLHRMLKLLGEVATHADFTLYPAPVMFRGGNLRGAIIGRGT